MESIGTAASAADAKGDFARTRAGLQSISSQLALARNAYLAFQSIQAAVYAAKDITDRVDAYSSFIARLKLATGSAESFKAAMSEVQRIAAATQAPVATVAQLYARLSNSLRAMGASSADTARITETVALALKISGATAAEAGSAMLQLSQAFASGTLRGDEFNSVNESAPRLMQALADSLGVPVGALRQMAEEGKLTSDVLAENLPKALEKLRAEAGKIPDTIGGSFQQLSDAFTKYLGQTGEASGLSNGLAGAVKTLADNFGLLGDAVIALGLGALIAGLFGAAGAMVTTATAAGGLTVSLGGLRVALLALNATPLGAFVTLASTLGLIVFGAAKLKDSLRDTTTTAKDEADKIAGARKDLEDRIEALVKRRVALEKQAAEDAKAAVKEAYEAAKKYLGEQIGDAERLRDALVKAFEEAGEKSKSLLDRAAALRAKATEQPNDNSVEGQALATLDLVAAQEKLMRLKGGDDLEATQKQAELVRKLADNINDAAYAQWAKRRADLDEAEALEKAAAAEKQRQEGLAIEIKANEGRLATFKTSLADIEQKLSDMAAETTNLKIQADEAAMAKVNGDLAALKAQLADLGRGVTIPVRTEGGGATIPGKAAGGLISGPGHDTSDNLLAWLSPGEFVMRAAAVRQWGVERLSSMNALRFPAFAAGGLVGAGGGGGRTVNVNLNLGGASYPLAAAPDVADGLEQAIRSAALKRGAR